MTVTTARLLRALALPVALSAALLWAGACGGDGSTATEESGTTGRRDADSATVSSSATSTPALQVAGTSPATPRYRSFGDCVLTLADYGAELDVEVEETDEGEVIVHVYGEESELRRIVGRCSNYDRPGESVSSCMLDNAWRIDGSIEVEEVFPDGEGGYEVTLSGFESGVAAILEECDREE